MPYRIEHHSIRTVFLGVDGKTCVGQVDRGEDPTEAVLVSYLAPGSDFRSDLIESLH